MSLLENGLGDEIFTVGTGWCRTGHKRKFGKFLLQSTTLGFRIRNPSNNWDRESKFHWQRSGTHYLDSGIQGVESRIQDVLDSLTWRDLWLGYVLSLKRYSFNSSLIRPKSSRTLFPAWPVSLLHTSLLSLNLEWLILSQKILFTRRLIFLSTNPSYFILIFLMFFSF